MRKIIVVLCLLLISKISGATTYDVVGTDVVNGGILNEQDIQNVHGVVNRYIIEGTQNIYDYGTAYFNNIVNTGQQNVYDGGKALNSSVFGGSINGYGGTITDATLENGIINLEKGTANNITIKGGELILNQSVILNGLTATGGSVRLKDNAIVNGASFNDTNIILENSKFENFDVNRGALINNGATVSDVNFFDTKITLLSGDNNNIFLEGGSIVAKSETNLHGDLYLSQSKLYIVGNNQVDNLYLNDSVVELTPINNIPTKLEIKKLQGVGQINIQTNFANNDSEVLTIEQGAGNFGLAIVDTSSKEEIPEQITLLDKNNNNQETFYLIGGELDIGARKYVLQEDTTRWFLQQTLRPTDTALIAKNTYATMGSVLYSHIDNIYVRTEEFRHGISNGLWIKNLGRRTKFNLNDNSKTKVDAYGLQIGADLSFKTKHLKKIGLGLAVGYADNKYNFDIRGRGYGDSYSASIYSTLLSYNNTYADFVAGYYWHKQKNKSHIPSGILVNSKYDLKAYSISAELGHRFMFDKEYFMEPHFQISYMNIGNVAYKTSLNTKVKGEGLDSVMGKIGVKFGKQWQKHGQIFASIDLVQEFDAKSKIKVADFTFEEKLNGTFVKLGLGTNWNINNKASLFANVGSMIGDDINIPIEGNLGIKVSF